MNQLFSEEFKHLISNSREMAIDLGYDHISTVHFYLADCEKNEPGSIFNFGFRNETDYRKFKAHYTLDNIDLLAKFDESLPLTLTKEAEIAIRLAIEKSSLFKQKLVYPCHLFMAALDNKDSMLSSCFTHDPHVCEKLVRYYEQSGAFEKRKMTEDEISGIHTPNNSKGIGFLKRIASLLKR